MVVFLGQCDDSTEPPNVPRTRQPRQARQHSLTSVSKARQPRLQKSLHEADIAIAEANYLALDSGNMSVENLDFFLHGFM